jgi:hypothetical protein
VAPKSRKTFPYPEIHGVKRAIFFGPAALLLTALQQAWTRDDLASFLVGQNARVWTLQAKKGKADFAAIRLGAKFKFLKDGKVTVIQTGASEKDWNWTLTADLQTPAGYRLNLNGNPYQITPIRISGEKTDKLALTSMDPKLQIPAKVYLTSPKMP